MKIGAIRKLILEEKRCVVLTGQQGQQWIGGQDWITRVDEGLKITRESIKGLFDLDTDQMEKMTIMELPMESYPLWPVLRRDMNPMKPALIDMNNYGGVEMLTFNGVVYLLEVKYIKAVISRDDYREYLLAWDEDTNPLIVIQDGMLFAGIARPMRAEVCRMLLEQMGFLSKMRPGGTRKPQENGPLDPSQAQDDSAEGGIQMDMDDFQEDKGHEDQ